VVGRLEVGQVMLLKLEGVQIEPSVWLQRLHHPVGAVL
jgi:hypothetical protein